MAKFTLLFVLVLCVVVQIAFCARIKREDEATTASSLDVVGQKLNVGLDATKQAFESTFTQENAEKIGNALKDVGNQFLDKIKKAFE